VAPFRTLPNLAEQGKEGREGSLFVASGDQPKTIQPARNDTTARLGHRNQDRNIRYFLFQAHCMRDLLQGFNPGFMPLRISAGFNCGIFREILELQKPPKSPARGGW
jgi:hypothetical protein